MQQSGSSDKGRFVAFFNEEHAAVGEEYDEAAADWVATNTGEEPVAVEDLEVEDAGFGDFQEPMDPLHVSHHSASPAPVRPFPSAAKAPAGPLMTWPKSSAAAPSGMLLPPPTKRVAVEHQDMFYENASSYYVRIFFFNFRALFFFFDQLRPILGLGQSRAL